MIVGDSPSTPKKRPREEAFAKVTVSDAKRRVRGEGQKATSAKVVGRTKLNFVDPDEPFVPELTHKLIGYSERGTKELSKEKMTIFSFVEKVCDIPKDFEADHKFGAKSGVCHEERVINAFIYGLLKPGGENVRRQIKNAVMKRNWTAAAELATASSAAE